jgi:hypothetical protein
VEELEEGTPDAVTAQTGTEKKKKFVTECLLTLQFFVA